MEDVLVHYGTPRHSGRYPWGSGENPYQHGGDFYNSVNKLRKDGMNDTDIAKVFDMSTTEFRKQYSIAKDEVKTERRAANAQLMEQGLNRSERARRLDVSESTLRSWENEDSIKRAEVTNATVR